MMKINLNIIYEDNHILVVFKPENILSQSDSSGDHDMLSLLKDYIKEKYNKQGNVYLALIHRLDRRVSGLMVFGKTSKAAARLSKDFQNREVKRIYKAIVLGSINEAGEIRNYLEKKKIDFTNFGIIHEKEVKGSKLAVLKYKKLIELIIKGEVHSLVEVELETGRYNQIRSQFANLGHPLVEDYKYGYRLDKEFDQIGLTCYILGFTHPTTKEYLEFVYTPSNGYWSK